MKSELIYEEWRPVRDYEGIYDASNFGRIRSLKYGKVRILKPAKNSKGYLQVHLWKNNKAKMLLVHRLVYEAFNGTIPEDYEINHINEIKTDNSLWNLNLMPHLDNIRYGTCIQRSSENRSKAVLQLTYPEGKFIKEWSSATEAGRHGFKQGAVSACCRGKLKQYKGFLWRKKVLK